MARSLQRNLFWLRSGAHASVAILVSVPGGLHWLVRIEPVTNLWRLSSGKGAKLWREKKGRIEGVERHMILTCLHRFVNCTVRYMILQLMFLCPSVISRSDSVWLHRSRK